MNNKNNFYKWMSKRSEVYVAFLTSAYQKFLQMPLSVISTAHIALVALPGYYCAHLIGSNVEHYQTHLQEKVRLLKKIEGLFVSLEKKRLALSDGQLSDTTKQAIYAYAAGPEEFISASETDYDQEPSNIHSDLLSIPPFKLSKIESIGMIRDEISTLESPMHASAKDVFSILDIVENQYLTSGFQYNPVIISSWEMRRIPASNKQTKEIYSVDFSLLQRSTAV